MHNKKMFDIESNESQISDEAQYLHGVILWQISKSMKNIKHFCTSFHNFYKLAFQIVDIENLDQFHGVQHSQCHSMANINLYKSHSKHLDASSQHFQDIYVSCLSLKI